jgi:uncharacterized protein YbcV (DUF1398 family)
MQTTAQVIEQCAVASQNGTANFGEIVKALMEVGVESYFADYRAENTRYYMPDGQVYNIDLEATGEVIADEFDAAAVKEAIRGAQRGDVKYPEFKKLTQAAGCIGYMVWLVGRHVTYFGRRGETHVEHFPSAQ